MTDNIVDLPPRQPNSYGADFIGPFVEEWKVTCDGYIVPKLSAVVQEGDHIVLMLDERFLVEGPKEEVSKYIPIIAHAMAIGAGYSCFGENSVKDPNPFQCKASVYIGP